MGHVLDKRDRFICRGHGTGRLWLSAGLLFLLLALLAPARVGGESARAQADDEVVDLEQIEKAFERVVEQVAPSVVGIRVQRRYMASLSSGDAASTVRVLEQLVTVNGSGSVIDTHGLILTNEHVIQAAHSIDVCFCDGQSLPATVVASDPRGDLALLKVDRDGLIPVRMADWSQVARGQWTIALGNPYGLGSGDGSLSVSVGVIANLDRQLPGLGEVDDRFYSDMIQTTAAIHPGCSGGPLFNVQGELVGLVTAMHTRAPADEGVGFAIPMNPARLRLIERLKGGRPIDYGYLGVTVRALEPEERQAAGLDPQIGAIVERVDPGGPAAEVGMHDGDLIVRFDDQPVRGPTSLAELVGQAAPGSGVSIELRRGEQRLAVSATLQRREVSRVSWMRGEAILWRGMRLAGLTGAARSGMDVEDAAAGVVVIDVVDDSPAQRASVRIGDVIERVADDPVSDLAAFQARVRGEGGAVRIRVRARGDVIIRP